MELNKLAKDAEEAENLFVENKADKVDPLDLHQHYHHQQQEPSVSIIQKSSSSCLNSYRGILIGIVSSLFLSMSNVFIKKAQLFSGTEQTAVRYALQMLVMLAIAFYQDMNIFGPREERKLLIMRGILGTCGLTTLHIAVKFINPSDAVAVFHTNVILVALIARCTLNARFSLFHILALLMAVAGVFLISQPQFLFQMSPVLSAENASISNITNQSNLGNTTNSTIPSMSILSSSISSLSIFIGVSIALLSSLFSSGVAILLKKLSNHNVHFSVAIIYACYFGLPFSLGLSALSHITHLDSSKKNPALFNTWEALAWQCVYSLISASCGVLSQILMNISLKYEEASKISIVRTTDLFFTFLFQLVFLNIHPNYLSVIGALLIFISSLIVMLYKFAYQKWNSPKTKTNDNEQSLFRKFLLYNF